MSFESLGLRSELLRAVTEKGYTNPTPIQLQAIPAVLDGHDVLGGAQTGTGKTAGFTLPMLHRLMLTSKKKKAQRSVRALVLVPTRELAAQVGDSINDYGKYLSLNYLTVFGGVKINPQIKQLSKGVDILVATPGRLLDHISQNTIDLSALEILVLDEADRMLDMGFIRDIRRILALVPENKQTLFFSATFSSEIRKLADQLLQSPVLVEVARKNTTAKSIQQVVHLVEKTRKRELLSYLIGSNNWQQVLVFSRTKHGADRLSKQLSSDGISSASIHGNKSQGARTRALADFKSKKIRVLVATDIAARGINVDQLPHVVNFDLPSAAEDYVHRIGRTGRAGNEGEAMSLVCGDELKILKEIQKLIKFEIPRKVIPGYESDSLMQASSTMDVHYISDNSGQSKNNNRRKSRGKGRSSFNNKAKSNHTRRNVA